jgi:tetratricopeptide (TPR) repeat protein
MLTNLDAAVANQLPALQIQGRIARARVTAYSARCAANDDVQELSEGILKGDLATLAAEGHLTPDLAFLWAGVQMADYSGAAAKPFLLLAKEGGYTDPAVVYMLGVIALEQRELDRADAHAVESAALYAKLGDRDQQAQSLFLRGEVARVRKDPEAARTHYEAAQKLSPGHAASILGVTRLVLTAEGPRRAVSTCRSSSRSSSSPARSRSDKVLAADNLEAVAQLASESELAGGPARHLARRGRPRARPRAPRPALLHGRHDRRPPRRVLPRPRPRRARPRRVQVRRHPPRPIDVDAFLARIDAVSNGD